MTTAGVPPGPAKADLQNVSGNSAILTFGIFVVAMAGLYFGRDLFVPLALAVLLSFALAPLVRWLRRLRIPRVPAVLATVVFAFMVIGGFVTVVAWQVMDLAESLPRYQTNMERKIDALQETPPGGSVFSRAAEVFQRLGERLAEPEEAPAAAPNPGPTASDPAENEPEPVPVTITQPELAPTQMLQTVVGPLIAPLATMGIVIVFVIFMLLQREDLRDRLIRLAGTRDLQRTTEALDDAARRVAHYLLMQLVVNVTYGIPIGLGLWAIGVPNAALWGLLAIVLRFVPYIGPFVAASFPVLLSIAVDPGWTMFLWTAALFIVIELISNNFVEPYLYGSSTGLSPVAIIVAAIFWTWLWGPVGLLLSTPLTVCLVVLGQHVPQLAFLDVLLGSDPVLTPSEHLYQRLLVGDPDEATERAEEYLGEHTLLQFYEEVALPALAFAEGDRVRGVLDDARREQVAEGALTVIDNLADHRDEIPDTDEDDTETEDGAAPAVEPSSEGETEALVLPTDWEDRPVICAGARGSLDDVAAAMLEQVLQRRGIGARLLSSEDLQSEQLAQLNMNGVRMICLSYMNSESLAHARYLVRRLKRRYPDVSIMVCFWTLEPVDVERRSPLAAVRADRIASSLSEAVAQVEEEARGAGNAERQAQPGLVLPLKPAAAI